MAGPDIESLINKIARLPGLGPRSARRITLHLLNNKDKILKGVISSLESVYNNVKPCPICGNIDTFDEMCAICNDKSRSDRILCIVESVSDLWAVERSRCFVGKYHVLNGLLSSMENRGPECLKLDNLVKRCTDNSVEEIIIALSATMDGQTTDMFIRNHLNEIEFCKNIKKTSLAVGIPLGGELDFLDDGTLFTAFNFRK